MLDENLIATLEQSLRQTRNAQNRLLVRLREVESEAERLRQEIEALENSAAQTEAAIFSLLATMRAGNQTWNINKQQFDDDAELQEIKRQHQQYQQQPPRSLPVSKNNPANFYRNNNQSSNQNNSLSYINSSKNAPPIAGRIEPVSHRFADRTITQACTLLLREAGKPLHVNELYNYLCAGGFEFKGNNPTISIAVSLNRNRRFRKVAPGTFDLVMRDASKAV
jgi:hypothetical protein